MAGWLKAGLVGFIIIVILNLIGHVPVLGCLTLPLVLVVYFITGVLAAAWMNPPRTSATAAGQGALAGLVAALGGGVVNLIISIFQASAGRFERYLSQVPPELLQQLQQAGLPPRFFIGVAGVAIGGTICCSLGLILAVLLAAAGGGIYAAIKPNPMSV